MIDKDGNGNSRDKSLAFDKFNNLRGFQIKHQKLISETKTVPKILKKPKKTKEQNKLQKNKTEIGKNSFWFKITPLKTILQIFPMQFCCLLSSENLCLDDSSPMGCKT